MKSEETMIVHDKNGKPFSYKLNSFAELFHTTQSDLQQHNGKSFKVLRPLTESEANIRDVGMMYEIELSTGEKIQAFEDEIS